jgi:hypothetical protein
MDFERDEGEKREGMCSRFEAARGGGGVNDRGERRKGVKDDSFYCGPTG